MAYDSKSTLQESVLTIARRVGSACLIIVALVFISSVPITLWHFSAVRPAVALAAVFYWAIFRPQTLSPAGVFALGFVLDLLYAGPLGLQACILVITQWSTRAQRRFLMGQSFSVLWMCFFLVSLLAYAFQWAVISLFEMSAMAVKPALAGAVMTGLFFPFVVWALNLFNKALADRPSSVA